MTDVAYPKLTLAEDIFKSLVWDSMTEIGINAIFAAAPYLNIFPIRQVIVYCLRQFSEKLFTALKLIMDVKAIYFVNEFHREAFDKASIKLRVIAHDRGIESDEFKIAREEAKKALAKFISFGAA